MTTDVGPLQSVQDKIRDKIRAEFANLIPDEVWQGMVANVVREFITDKTEYSRPVPSPLKQMIWGALKEIAEPLIKAELERLDQSIWDGYGGKVAGEAVKAVIAEHFPVLLASFQKGLVEAAVMAAVNAMRNGMR